MSRSASLSGGGDGRLGADGRRWWRWWWSIANFAARPSPSVVAETSHLLWQLHLFSDARRRRPRQCAGGSRWAQTAPSRHDSCRRRVASWWAHSACRASARVVFRRENCEYRVRLRAEPNAAPLTVTKLRVRPKWQREGAVFVQPSRGFGVRTIADARAVLLRHDIPAVAGKLQDYVAVARLKASLENLRVQRQQLLSRQPRAPAERQLFAEHAALAVGDWIAAAPALMPASQLASVFKSAYTQLGAMCAVEPMRCTPAAFISVPRLTRLQRVQWCVCDCCTWRCGFCSARWDPSPS